MKYDELMAKGSYELVELLNAQTKSLLNLYEVQNDVCNQQDYDCVAKEIEEKQNDLSMLCTCTERVIANEQNTKKETERDDLYKKYADKYFRYGEHEVIFFDIQGDKRKMDFFSVSNCGKPMLKIKSRCSYKKYVYFRTRGERIDGYSHEGEYFCDFLEEITKEDFDGFFINRSL